MATRQWVCDTCGRHSMSEPWTCPGCKSETCEMCFSSFAHCKKCCDGKSDQDLVNSANAYGYEFVLSNEPGQVGSEYR